MKPKGKRKNIEFKKKDPKSNELTFDMTKVRTCVCCNKLGRSKVRGEISIELEIAGSIRNPFTGLTIFKEIVQGEKGYKILSQ